MANCGNIDSNYVRTCENNLASGSRGFYLSNWTGSSTYVYTVDGQVNSGNTGFNPYYSIEQRTGVAEYREEMSVNAQYGSRTITPTIVITFLGQSQAVRNLANDIAQGVFDAIVELEAGEYILLSKMEASAGNANPGVGAEDPNIIQVTLTGRARSFAPTITAPGLAELTA